MGEFKFRAWNRIVGRMQYFTLPDLEKQGDKIQWQNLVITQYTGIIDKNGKDVYFEDIVSAWSEGYNHIGVVKMRFEAMPSVVIYPAFANQGFWKIHGNRNRDNAFTDGKIDDGIEVVGNIYENPELVEKHSLKLRE